MYDGCCQSIFTSARWKLLGLRDGQADRSRSAMVKRGSRGGTGDFISCDGASARRMYAGNNVGPATTCVRPNFTARDRQQLANSPYEQAPIPHAYQRQIVQFPRKEAPGWILVDTDARFLYYVLPEEKAIRYGVIVGEDAQAWSGVRRSVGSKNGQVGRRPRVRSGGSARFPTMLKAALTIRWAPAGFTFTRTTRTSCTASTAPTSPQWIGHASSSGCVRMTDEDVIDLYSRVKMGTIVVVLGPKQDDFRIAAAAIGRTN